MLIQEEIEVELGNGFLKTGRRVAVKMQGSVLFYVTTLYPLHCTLFYPNPLLLTLTKSSESHNLISPFLSSVIKMQCREVIAAPDPRDIFEDPLKYMLLVMAQHTTTIMMWCRSFTGGCRQGVISEDMTCLPKMLSTRPPYFF